jgi:hypothetical protein
MLVSLLCVLRVSVVKFGLDKAQAEERIGYGESEKCAKE